MSEINNILKSIQKSPNRYLPFATIGHLKSFLCGYQVAMSDMGMIDRMGDLKLNEFQNWLKEKFNFEDIYAWDKIAILVSMNEITALDTFFELYDEFLETQQNS